MLERLASLQVKALADKALAVRDARNRFLTGIREAAFGEPKPARGVHDASAALGFNVLPASDPDRKVLDQALAALPPAALRELWALVLIGRGAYRLESWDRAIAEANGITDLSPALFMEDVGLYEHLMNALHELDRM
jgi:hypothetical protein